MITRGGVFWVEVDKRRPCVVVSSYDVLSVDLWQVHVVPLTFQIDRAGIAGNVLLAAKLTGLPHDSVAVPLGLELIDRSLLGEETSRIPAVLLEDVDSGIGIAPWLVDVPDSRLWSRQGWTSWESDIRKSSAMTWCG